MKPRPTPEDERIRAFVAWSMREFWCRWAPRIEAEARRVRR